MIHIWSIVPIENWGAFAPGFEELEENHEYEEREDEFDVVSRPASRLFSTRGTQHFYVT